jgi:hypothetical protein
MIPIEKNITVVGPQNEQLQGTYPKRAKGLVKKGRAYFVSPDTIKMNVRPPGAEDFMKNFIDNTAVETAAETVTETAAETVTAQTAAQTAAPSVKDANTVDARELVNRYRGFIIGFNPREWKPNPDIKKNNVTNRTFITESNGDFVEAWQLGDWNWNWSEVVSGDLVLEKYTEYRFLFWQKDGRHNDNHNVCRFEIVFDGDYESRLIYSLLDDCVKPLIKSDGWNLYCIPFVTGGNEITTLRFVAQRAPMSVKPAIYDELEFLVPDDLPQRVGSQQTGDTPKLDFSGIMGFDFDDEDLRENIFDFLNNPAIPGGDKINILAMLQGTMNG